MLTPSHPIDSHIHRGAKQLLVDPSGRIMRKLRISIIDACQFRCFYCLPHGAAFMPQKQWLTPTEITDIANDFVKLGITHLRVTGGEPTLRPDFLKIMELLRTIPNIHLGLTTNGENLSSLLSPLKELALDALNISLDSLDPHTFEKINQRKTFTTVWDNIHHAIDMGFLVKINAVITRTTNFSELMSFVEFAEAHPIEVRFLELMNLGPVQKIYTDEFVSAAEMMQTLSQYRSLSALPIPLDHTAKVYATDRGGRIGFIASESQPFCSSCSRLRLSPNGEVRACLMHNKQVSLRHKSTFEREHIIRSILPFKPTIKIETQQTAMYRIGG